MRKLSLIFCIAVFLIGLLTISSFYINEYILRNSFLLPNDFVPQSLQNATNRSAMHGAMYFSFKCSETDFVRITQLNELYEVTDFPESIEKKGRNLSVRLMEYNKLPGWPKMRTIVAHPLFSNIDSFFSSENVTTKIKFAFLVEDTAYLVANPFTE